MNFNILESIGSKLLLSLVIHTANILGIFNDQFEFEGNYGLEANSTRQQVFEWVVSKEALAKNLTGAKVRLLMGDSSADEVISIEGYDGFGRSRMKVILATRIDSWQKFLLASSHGYSSVI